MPAETAGKVEQSEVVTARVKSISESKCGKGDESQGWLHTRRVSQGGGNIKKKKGRRDALRKYVPDARKKTR